MAARPVDQSGDIQQSIGSQWAVTVLAFIFLGLRLFLKLSRTQNRSLWVDDILLILAFSCLVATCSLRTAAINFTDSHAPNQLTPKDIGWLGLMNAVAGALAQGGTMLSKTSFCFTLLRIVTGRSKAIVWGAIGSMNVVLVLAIVFLLAQCRPIEASWNIFVKGDCWPDTVVPRYGIFASAYSVVMDFALVALVWKVILGLQMKTVEKYGVAVGMSIGVIAGITGIVKCVYLGQLNFLKLFIWESVEISVTIVAACIPVLRVVVISQVRAITSKYGLGSGGRTANMTGKGRHRTSFHAKIDNNSQDVGSDDKSERFILTQMPVSREQAQSFRETV